MKIRLKDGKTVIDHVQKIDERVNIVDNGGNPILIIHVSYDGEIDGDMVARYNTEIGFDDLTLLDEKGRELCKYSTARKLASIHVAYIESGKSLVLTFESEET